MEIAFLLDKADEAVKLSRQREKKTNTLRGLTQINLFFEASTRTQASFELAGKRLGADVMNMSVGNSSVKKGEDPGRYGHDAQCHASGHPRGPPRLRRSLRVAGPEKSIARWSMPVTVPTNIRHRRFSMP